MKRLVATVALTLLLAGTFTAPAAAEFVFFDDFDGNALLPHWSVPPPQNWEYSVSGGMLNVTGLFNPSHPKFPSNYAIMGAPFAAQTDFQLDTTMGWGTSEGVTRFEVIVRVNSGLVASIGYREDDVTGPPGLYAWTDAGMITIPPPSPGMYDFTIARVGALFHFYFEGDLFATLPSAYTGPVNGLSFYFSSPYPGQSGPFHVDRVQVVPAPATSLLYVVVVLGFPWRRRS